MLHRKFSRKCARTVNNGVRVAYTLSDGGELLSRNPLKVEDGVMDAIRAAIEAVQGARLDWAGDGDSSVYAKLGETLRHLRIAERKAQKLIEDRGMYSRKSTS